MEIWAFPPRFWRGIISSRLNRRHVHETLELCGKNRSLTILLYWYSQECKFIFEIFNCFTLKMSTSRCNLQKMKIFASSRNFKNKKISTSMCNFKKNKKFLQLCDIFSSCPNFKLIFSCPNFQLSNFWVDFQLFKF